MKKQFMTFCALILLTTQAHATEAAVNSDEATNNSKGTVQTVQLLSYKTILLNKDLDFKNSISQIIEFISKKTNTQSERVKESQPVKQVVSEKKRFEKPAKANIQTPAKEKPEVPSKEVVKAPTKEEPKATEKEENNVNTQAPSKEEQKVNTQSPVKEEPKENTSAPVKEEPKAPVTQTPTQPVQEVPGKVATPSTDIDAMEVAVVQLTNAERVNAGLQPLQTYSPLMAAAREKSQDMKNNNYFSHTSPTFGSPFDRLKALGISYKAAGENIAKGQRSAEEVVSAWMNSEGHRANILNPNFTHIGVGYVKDGNIWTQQFIKQ